MNITDFDVKNIALILDGQGDWFSAYTLRFINAVLAKADSVNKAKLWRAFPEECETILRYWGWPEGVILAEKTRFLKPARTPARKFGSY